MRPTTCPRGFINRLLFAVTAACLTVSVLIGQEPQPPVKPKDLTPEQQEKLKERGRLKAEVEKLRKEEKLTEAVAAAEKMVEIGRDVFGKESEEVAESLATLAETYEERADFTAVRTARAEVLRVQTARHGEAHWKATDARLAFADVQRLANLSAADLRQLREARWHDKEAAQLYRQGKYREADDPRRKSLAIRQQVLGPDHPDTATSLNKLGVLLWHLGDYAGARAHYEQSLAIRKKALGPEHPDTAQSIGNLGLLLYTQGDYAGARPYCERAVAVHKKVLGPEHPDTGRTLGILGSLLDAQGDYAGARPYCEQVLAIYKKALGPEHPHTAGSLNNLGSLLEKQGDYAGARAYHEQALAIYKKALDPEHPDTAISLNNLGSLLEKQGDHAGARPYYEQALAIFKKALGPEHPHTATCLMNLGSLLKAQGDYTGARPYADQALAIRKKALGPEHPVTVLSLNNVGYLLQAQGDYAGARPYYEEALATMTKALGPEHPNTAGGLNNLGYLLGAQGDAVGARPYHAEALAIAAKHLDLAAAGLAERQQRAMAADSRRFLDAFLSLAARADVRAADAFRPVLRWKGAVLARQRAAVVGRDSDPEFLERCDKYKAVCRRLSQLSRDTPEPKQREAWREEMEKLTREKEALEVELAGRSDTFKRQQALRQLTPEQLQKALPADSALVDFLEYTHYTPPADGKGKMKFERHLVACVVRPDKPVVQLDLGPLEPITATVNDWRKSQRAGEGGPGATLRRLVWEPLEAHLKDVQTILISPDGALARLPFAALPGKEPGTYLIEERALAVVPVPQLLPELLDPGTADTAAAHTPSLLLIGDVDYGAASGNDQQEQAVKRSAPRGNTGAALPAYKPLKATLGEALVVQQHFQDRFPDGKVRLLKREGATEAAFREHSGKHRYLHLATHGFFAPPSLKSAFAATKADTPGSLFGQEDISGWHPGLLSGLVLAGANQPIDPERDDGILTALEVAALDLSGVDLVVLSACETGLGEVAGGEGLLGLQRAFQTAGAKSVVASLWEVQDDVTRALMEQFYENLWVKKMSKAEALRQAQLTLLREGGKRGLGSEDDKAKRRLPPYYWAGFVLSGDWR